MTRCVFNRDYPSSQFDIYRSLDGRCPHIAECSKRGGGASQQHSEMPLELFAVLDGPCGLEILGKEQCGKPKTNTLWITGKSVSGPNNRSTQWLELVPQIRSLKPDALLLRDPESNRETETVALNRRQLVIPPASNHTSGVDDATYVDVVPRNRSLTSGALEISFSGVPSRLSRFVRADTAMQVRLSGLSETEQGKSPTVDVQAEPNPGLSTEESAPVIGIITAKAIEFSTCAAILDRPRHVFVKGRGAGRRYYAGEIPAPDGGTHSVVLAMLVDHGNNSVAGRAAKLLSVFPSIQLILMVGIAGGVPSPNDPERHVRLGDVVVCDRSGVIQYDYQKETSTFVQSRHPPRPPAAVFIEAIGHIESERLMRRNPQDAWLKIVCERMGIVRPPPETDQLARSDDPSEFVVHPADAERRPDVPRVFSGPIASANKLLKDAEKRDLLRDEFGVKAIEMEGSGIADSAWQESVGYGVIRGISDYCDHNKNDVWQPYAASAAAALCRAVLEATPTLAGR